MAQPADTASELESVIRETAWIHDYRSVALGPLAKLLAEQRPLAVLELLVACDYENEKLRVEAVCDAREEGASWERIGKALGVSRQTAHARYAPYVPRAVTDS